MKKIRFPRIRKGYGKLVSVLRRRVGRKRTEQLPAQGSEAERYENEQLAVMQHSAVQCEDERHEAVQCEAGGFEDEQRGNEQLAEEQHAVMQCEDELRENEQLAVEQHEVVQCEDELRGDERLAMERHEDEQRENEHHRKAEACNQQQCSLREFCLKRFSEKRDAHAAGGASPDKAKR